MHVYIQYNGQIRAAIVTDELVRYGEEFIEVEIEGYKISKILHRNHIVQFNWTIKVA